MTLIKRNQVESTRNRLEFLRGVCGTCHQVAERQHFEAVALAIQNPTGKEPGAWSDLPSTECLHCKAKVYLMPMTKELLVERLERLGFTASLLRAADPALLGEILASCIRHNE